MGKPWDNWIPGVLNKEQMRDLCEEGLITGGDDLEESIGKSAIDLSISGTAYEMLRGTVKPTGSTEYGFFITRNDLAKPCKLSDDGTLILRSKNTYVFKLNERLNTSELKNAGIHGLATAKSSVGRIDVLARLIIDGMDTYETFNPDRLTNSFGDMYLEITPITFDVKVKQGAPLSQLRLFRGKPEDAEIGGGDLFKTLLGPQADDGSLSVDLSDDTKVGGAAFRAVADGKREPIPLWEQPEGEMPRPEAYWEVVGTDHEKRLTIEQGRFYILRSKERIWVPEGIAIYCRATDETIGEMRIHYAGFVHPIFGQNRDDSQRGTPLIFEVRGHQINVSLANEEKLAKLTFYRMSKDHQEEEEGGKGGESGDLYNNQGLKLSKFFGDWPSK